jgi:hypothetical protein
MPVETLTWLLSGALFIITCVGGALYKMLRDEAKDHHERIEKRASVDRLNEVENRWQTDLTNLKQNNKELITELRQKHDRDIDQMGARFSEQLKTMESNILSRLELMIATVNARHTP